MIKFVSTVGLAIVFAVSGTSTFGQFLYGISNGSDVPEDNTIYRIDPSNGRDLERSAGNAARFRGFEVAGSGRPTGRSRSLRLYR